MGELWRDLVELLRRRPALWVPVLLADLLGYLVNLGRGGILRAVVMHESAQRSALGGSVVHAPLTASAMQTAAIIGLLLTWLTYFVRMLLYSGALIATAALVQSYLQRQEHPGRTVGPALGSHWGGILELSLRGLAVYAIAALLFSWTSTLLAHHNGDALLRNPTFAYGITLLVLLVLSALLPPVALRILSGRKPDRLNSRLSQQFAFVLVIVASLLAAFVGSNNREMAHVQAAARYPLEMIGSLVVALPYVLMFVGLAVLAQRVRTAEPESVAP
jgi:hypothetical protein